MQAHIENWKDWLRYSCNKAASTVGNYQRYIKMWVEHCVANEIDALNPALDQLQIFTGPVLHKPGPTAKGLAAPTRRIAVMALRSFYSYLNITKVTPRNYSEGLSPPALGLHLPEAIPLEYAERLMWAPDLDSLAGVRDAAIISLLIGCGIRLSGLSSLNESHLLFEHEGQVERLSIKVTEKGSKQRFVPAPDEARLMVRAYLGHPELQDIDRRLKNGDKVLFISLANRTVPEHEYRGEHRRMGNNGIQKMISRYGRIAGVPDRYCHPHAFRHLYGKELAEAGVDILVRQSLMGHADIGSTKIYSHIAVRQLRLASEKGNPLKQIKSPARALAEKLRSAGL